MSDERDAGRFLSQAEVEAIGFKHVGADVEIDRDATFLFPENIEIGDRSRIDFGVLISAGPAGVFLDYNVHLGANSMIFGGGGRVTFRPFSGFSSQVRCYTGTDDYLGNYLSGPTVPNEFKNVINGPVYFDRCVMVGSGCLILPNVYLKEGAVCCAHTVVTQNVPEGIILFGSPARRIGERNLDELRALRRKYLESIGRHDLAAQVGVTE